MASQGIVHVDLSQGAVTRRRIPRRRLEKYVGGKGVGARYYAVRDRDRRGRPTAELRRRLDVAGVPDEATPVPTSTDRGSTTEVSGDD